MGYLELIFQTLKNNKVLTIDFGDEQILKEHFHRYFDDLFHFAIMLVKNESLAEELVHDVFLKLWEKKRSVEVSVGIKSYLFAAVKNTCLNHLKKHNPDFVELDLERSSPDGIMDNPEELRKLLRKGVYALPEKCRAVFILSRQFGMSYQEISETLEVSKNTVENQMVIALRKLRVFLKSDPNLILLLFL